MNKSNQSGINNYLTNASLFKNNQKNKFVSAYITHKNYFERNEQQTSNSIHSPNPTKSKKDNPFMLAQSVQIGEKHENNDDALKATVKDGDYGYNFLGMMLRQVQKNMTELSIQQQNHPQHIQEKQVQEKVMKQAQPQPKDNSQIDIDLSGKQVKQKNSTKIVVNYSKQQSFKQKGIKMQHKSNQDIQQENNRKNSYLNIKEEVNQSQKEEVNQSQKMTKQKQDMNPYFPTSVKKQREGLNIYRTETGEAVLKKMESNSFNPIQQRHQQDFFITHSSIQHRRNSDHERQDYLSNIKKDMNGYILALKERLNGTYICLQTIQNEFDVHLQKTLNLECEKMKSILNRLVQDGLNDYRELSRRQFLKSKFLFMSDLCEIKCNIDLRLEQIEQYQLQLKNEYNWKSSVSSIMVVDYNQNINFIIKKADQIEKDLINSIGSDLNQYVKGVNEEVNKKLIKSIKEAFQEIYIKFNEIRKKSRPKGFTSSSQYQQRGQQL